MYFPNKEWLYHHKHYVLFIETDIAFLPIKGSQHRSAVNIVWEKHRIYMTTHHLDGRLIQFIDICVYPMANTSFDRDPNRLWELILPYSCPNTEVF